MILNNLSHLRRRSRIRPGRSVNAGLAGVVGILLVMSTVGTALAAATWLDQPPRAWNQAGTAIPKAPPIDTSVQAMCRTNEVAANGTEETQLSDAGWLIESYWKTQRQGNVTFAVGNSSYDGMCRPLGFNGFVFIGGHFAGTLSPVNMNSRSDGVLQAIPTLQPGSPLHATYLRYSDRDPLCCPSLPPVQVTYRIDGTGVNQILVPDTIAHASELSSLPRAGEPFQPITLALVVGSVAIAIGFVWRARISGKLG